jgi:hypothetical protein
MGSVLSALSASKEFLHERKLYTSPSHYYEGKDEAFCAWEVAMKRHEANLHIELGRYRREYLAIISKKMLAFIGSRDTLRILQGLIPFLIPVP